MKVYNINQFEKLNINPIKINDLNDIDIDSTFKYLYFPKTKEELQLIISNKIDIYGYNVDMNNIDVSKITDMSFLFSNTYVRIKGKLISFEKFNGDISEWNVSNVKDMRYMFANSMFDGDISNWDVSNVINVTGMFINCPLGKHQLKQPKFRKL